MTGDSVLHLLARTDALALEQKLRVFEKLKKDYRNPLIPNFKNKRAIDLTTDPVLKQQLAYYMEFRTDARVLEWYGPMLRKRLTGLLLVLRRLGVGANKDERLLMMQYIARAEHVYVPSKE